MNTTDFHASLSEIEKVYWHKLAELFRLVHPRKPEIGIKVLILRARKASVQKGTEPADELEIQFQGAKERTLRRVELLSHCQLGIQSDDERHTKKPRE